jgi:hypothetical protein
VTKQQLRRLFATGDFPNRAIEGEFGCCLTAWGRATRMDESEGTLSMMVSYVDEWLDCVFLVHLYLRPDGSIGASGRADPKRLFEDGVVYVPKSSRSLNLSTLDN